MNSFPLPTDHADEEPTRPASTRPAARLGARWDDASQTSRFAAARDLGLLDYVEVNFPISAGERPHELGMALLAHTSNNPLCSCHGVHEPVAAAVRASADAWDSPWIGEHLAWLGAAPSGALGYVLNPLFSTEFAAIAVANIRALRTYYGRPIALELGPVYGKSGDFASELHFLAAVAEAADAMIILDVTHWTISNRNLRRDVDFGLDVLDPSRIVELHVAGLRPSRNGEFWHDAHGIAPPPEVIAMTGELVRGLPSVRAVTLEHGLEGKAADFVATLDRLRTVLA